MGDRSMRACLDEQLDVLREAARLHSISVCGYSLQQWYDEGADLKVFLDSPDVIGGDDDLDQVSKFVYAWGYLEGAADMADLTVLELLALHERRFDATPEARRRRKAAR